MKNGAFAILTKPIDEVALIGGVERALDLNRTQKQGGTLTVQRTTAVTSSYEHPAGELGITENIVKMCRGISCGKWKPISSRPWLRSPASQISRPVAHPNRKCVWPVSYEVM
jgi:hypothetical protein